MPSAAFGAAALIVLRSLPSAARRSGGAAARYPLTVFAFVAILARGLVVSVTMAIDLPPESIVRSTTHDRSTRCARIGEHQRFTSEGVGRAGDSRDHQAVHAGDGRRLRLARGQPDRVEKRVPE